MIRNFRPAEIGQVFGQEHLSGQLFKWCESPETIPQSVLFSGPFGTGKTSIARILAKKLVTNDSDLDEINAAEARGIDDVRQWAESSRFRPFGSAKVHIIDELHQMTQAAQSALLKVIEEPPEGIYWFLCTTEVSKLLPAIRSRCTPIEVRPLHNEAAKDLLLFLTKGSLSEEMMDAIVARCGGHARDLVKLAEVVVETGVGPESLSSVTGISSIQAQQILRKVFTGEASWGDARDVQTISDPRFLGQMIDQAVDEAVCEGNSKILPVYHELLQMRVARVEWKISAKEQFLHLMACINR